MSSRILIVDDEPAVADLIEAVLVGEGYTVAIARDGAQGLMLARDWRPDLILIYQKPDPQTLQCVRLGSHSELGSMRVRPCSQFCNVATGTWMDSAKRRCDRASRLRMIAGEMMSSSRMALSDHSLTRACGSGCPVPSSRRSWRDRRPA